MGARPFFDILPRLWERPADDSLAYLLPRDAVTLESFHSRLRSFVERAPRRAEGEIEAGAIVAGEIVSMAEGSVIEAGAVVHRSCRLVLGPRSRVRSGAVLRDEVVVGMDTTIGVNCEVVRSLILGPHTVLGHVNFVGDSILGRDVQLSGYSCTANNVMKPGRSVHLKYAGVRIDSRRSHLGALVGDGARFGASVTLCPGCVVLPGLSFPPGAILYGTIDRRKRDVLVRRFYEEWDLDEPRARSVRRSRSASGLKS